MAVLCPAVILAVLVGCGGATKPEDEDTERMTIPPPDRTIADELPPVTVRLRR